jgi:L-seryl-tRNA(Ser) seleniumtransferase
VVNNNAAAVLLTIAALAGGREVVVSRGELVEIGGAFRMPDVMASAGAKMVEVGTTNRTHLADYERAITPSTALLMKVHTSNYAVQGFTHSVTEAELAPLAKARGVALATDLGSGSLIDMSRYGLPREPTPQQMLAAGCGVVTFSGDKLLGGPQAGLIVGDKDHDHPHPQVPHEARPAPVQAAAGCAGGHAAAVPAARAAGQGTAHAALADPQAQADIAATAQALLAPLTERRGTPLYRQQVALMSQIGSGSLPVDLLPSAGLAIAPDLSGKRGVGTALDALSTALRELPMPVIGRIGDDQLLLDCRCLDDAAPLIAQLGTLRARLLGA